MPGIPGRGGPAPKRADQRHGHRSVAENSPDRAPGAPNVQPPPARRDWHPIARDWYRSLFRSGQSVFYEPSDWQTARWIAECMSRDLRQGGPPKGANVAAYLKAMSTLLTTEGERRRSRIELERGAQVDADDDAAVAKLDEYRHRIAP